MANTIDNIIANIIAMLEEEYKTNGTFVSVHDKIGKNYKEVMDEEPEIFYFASKSRVVLITWICDIIKKMFAKSGYSEINLAVDGYEEIRTSLNTRAFNRNTLCELFGCSKSRPMLSFSSFIKYEEKYFEKYNDYSIKKIKPRKAEDKAVMMDINAELRKILSDTREKEVLLDRCHGFTLDNIGKKLDVTRERARQIEFRPREKIRKWMDARATDFVNDICDDKVVVDSKAIKFFEKENWEILKYCITSDKEKYMWTYIKCLDIIIFDQNNNFENLIEDGIKENIMTTDLIEIMQDNGFTFFNLDIAHKYLNSKNYHIYEDAMYTGKMTIGKASLLVAKKHFPNGIQMTDRKAMEQFSELLNQNYGLDTTPSRALEARMQDVLVMCEKATYCAPSNLNLDMGEVFGVIYQILNSFGEERITYSALFNSNRNILCPIGITNEYILHGILKKYEEQLGLFCMKYYVCKSDVNKVLSKEYFAPFNQWMLEQGKPVYENAIIAAFPGWNLKTIRCAMGYYNNIVAWDDNYFFNLDSIILEDDTIQQFTNLLQTLTSNEYKYTSSYILYREAKKICPDFIKKYNIRNEKQFYYIIQYMFKRKYVFRRPHISSDLSLITFSTEYLVSIIAKNDAEINKQEVTNKLIECFGEKNSSLNLALQKHLTNYIRTGAHTYYRKDKISLTKSCADQILAFINKNMIKNEICILNGIKDFSELPVINCKWNAWVLSEVIDLFNVKVKKIERKNTPSQSSMAIVVREDSELQTKDEVFKWLIANDYDPNIDKSEFQYAKKIGIFHTNLTSEEVNKKLGL